MAQLTATQVAALALEAGLTPSQATTAVAIAKGESSFRTDAVGDRSLTTATWGPSVGLWQIRSLNAQRGTGGIRDESRLRDPQFNARSMVALFSQRGGWGDWTVYNTGDYRRYLDEARAGVAAATGSGSGDGGGIGGLIDSVTLTPGEIVDGIGGLFGDDGPLPNPLNPFGIPGDILDGFRSLLGPLISVAEFWRDLFTPETLKRVGKGLAGLWLVNIGVGLAAVSLIGPEKVAGAAAGAAGGAKAGPAGAAGGAALGAATA